MKPFHHSLFLFGKAMIHDSSLEEYRLVMGTISNRYKINNLEQSLLPSELNSIFR